jgi:hypothetical protein
MLELNMSYTAGRNYAKAAIRAEDIDAATEGPAMTALRALPQIVPNPPVRGDEESVIINTQQSIHLWKTWIQSHRDELEKLKPNGKGVDFSDHACDKRPRVSSKPR